MTKTKAELVEEILKEKIYKSMHLSNEIYAIRTWNIDYQDDSGVKLIVASDNFNSYKYRSNVWKKHQWVIQSLDLYQLGLELNCQIFTYPLTRQEYVEQMSQGTNGDPKTFCLEFGD